MPLPRLCKNCGGRFVPETKYQYLCRACQAINKNVNFIKLICARRGIDKSNIIRRFI
jgi:hypothetical protein